MPPIGPTPTPTPTPTPHPTVTPTATPHPATAPATEGGENHGFWGGLGDVFGLGRQAGQAYSVSNGQGILDLTNKAIQTNGLTQGARTANQAMHLADNAKLMGNEAMASRFGALAEDSRGPLNALADSPVSKLVGGAGGVLGGLSMAQGVGEFASGNKTQGSLDMISGGLGVAAMVQPELAPVALAAGLVASGNGQTKDWGWWGKNSDGTNRDSVQFVGDSTSSAYNSVNKWAGGGVAGGIAGGIAGGATALGTGALALGGDLVGGVANVATGIGSLASDVGQGIGNAAGAVGGAISDGVGAVLSW